MELSLVITGLLLIVSVVSLLVLLIISTIGYYRGYDLIGLLSGMGKPKDNKQHKQMIFWCRVLQVVFVLSLLMYTLTSLPIF